MQLCGFSGEGGSTAYRNGETKVELKVLMGTQRGEEERRGKMSLVLF